MGSNSVARCARGTADSGRELHESEKNCILAPNCVDASTLRRMSEDTTPSARTRRLNEFGYRERRSRRSTGRKTKAWWPPQGRGAQKGRREEGRRTQEGHKRS